MADLFFWCCSLFSSNFKKTASPSWSDVQRDFKTCGLLMCRVCLLCILYQYGKHCRQISPFTSAFITLPAGGGGMEV